MGKTHPTLERFLVFSQRLIRLPKSHYRSRNVVRMLVRPFEEFQSAIVAPLLELNVAFFCNRFQGGFTLYGRLATLGFGIP